MIHALKIVMVHTKKNIFMIKVLELPSSKNSNCHDLQTNIAPWQLYFKHYGNYSVNIMATIGKKIVETYQHGV